MCWYPKCRKNPARSGQAFPFIFSQAPLWEKGSFAASPADFSVRQYPVRADASVNSTGQWLPPLTCTGKLRSLYLCREGLPPSVLPPQDNFLHYFRNGLVKIPAVLQIRCRKLLQKKSQFTIYFHWKFFDNWLFLLSCIIFSFTMKKQQHFYVATV